VLTGVGALHVAEPKQSKMGSPRKGVPMFEVGRLTIVRVGRWPPVCMHIRRADNDFLDRTFA